MSEMGDYSARVRAAIDAMRRADPPDMPVPRGLPWVGRGIPSWTPVDTAKIPRAGWVALRFVPYGDSSQIVVTDCATLEDALARESAGHRDLAHMRRHGVPEHLRGWRDGNFIPDPGFGGWERWAFWMSSFGAARLPYHETLTVHRMRKGAQRPRPGQTVLHG